MLPTVTSTLMIILKQKRILTMDERVLMRCNAGWANPGKKKEKSLGIGTPGNSYNGTEARQGIELECGIFLIIPKAAQSLFIFVIDSCL